MTPFTAELIGTMLLVLMGEGVVANVSLNKTKGQNAGLMLVTTAWALGVFIGVVVAGPYSGAHLNPAVTLGLAAAGTFAGSKVIGYIVAQMIGAAIGALLVWVFYRDHFKVTDDPAAKLGIFCTIPAIRNYASNYFSEVLGTFVLVFVVLHITDGALLFGPTQQELSSYQVGLGSVGALPVAFLVWVIGMALGGTTGYAINPARDLAPRFMHSILPIPGKGTSDWAYAWIPATAPLVGGLIAAWVFLLLG